MSTALPISAQRPFQGGLQTRLAIPRASSFQGLLDPLCLNTANRNMFLMYTNTSVACSPEEPEIPRLKLDFYFCFWACLTHRWSQGKHRVPWGSYSSQHCHTKCFQPTWKSLCAQRIVTAVGLLLSGEPGRPSSLVLGTITEPQNGLCWKRALEII